MKRVLFLLMITLMAGTVVAQPKNRRQQQTQQQGAQSQNQGMSMRARLMFPTAIDMPEDVVWRRDIYREIDLSKNANGGLYYPVEPIDRQVNLFTYIFKLALNGYIPVYEYRLDGNESFSDSSRVDIKTILENHKIHHTESNGKLHVDNSDIPSAEVKLYYLKESAYYDQANSSFHRKVLALCPVMFREDDYSSLSSDDAFDSGSLSLESDSHSYSKYPLFWVKYSDLEPFLSRQSIMTSNLNNAATMSMDDYFTLNRYEGTIYKTNNMLGKTLAQICGNDTVKLNAEQKRIEAELKAFEQNIFGDKARKDSLDSIAKLDPRDVKAAKKGKRTSRRSTATVKKSKPAKSSSGSSSGSVRMSVRRQRH
ncbi:gliding motility associated protien GldN [Prevotellaceae bacterium HUN156]|nr:gliding motility associated protien GldN [Prevotellaceae bacterium HUN156]